jgi:hypothetical protein
LQLDVVTLIHYDFHALVPVGIAPSVVKEQRERRARFNGEFYEHDALMPPYFEFCELQ